VVHPFAHFLDVLKSHLHLYILTHQHIPAKHDCGQWQKGVAAQHTPNPTIETFPNPIQPPFSRFSLKHRAQRCHTFDGVINAIILLIFKIIKGSRGVEKLSHGRFDDAVLPEIIQVDDFLLIFLDGLVGRRVQLHEFPRRNTPATTLLLNSQF